MTDQPMGIQKVGTVWYKREQYGAVRAYMDDGMNLPLTYEQWLSAAEKGLAQLGNSAVKAELDLPVFREWCKERRLRPNAKTRTHWASQVARESLEA